MMMKSDDSYQEQSSEQKDAHETKKMTIAEKIRRKNSPAPINRRYINQKAKMISMADKVVNLQMNGNRNLKKMIKSIENK